MSEVWEKLIREARASTFTEVYVTVTSGREVLIENVTHVYECNEIMARVRSRDGDVVIWGEDLRMSSFRESVVKITGRIKSVELVKRAGIKDD